MDFDDTELNVLLSQIRGAINDNELDQVIITGDINTDFRRNTGFVKAVEDFISEFKFNKSWDTFQVDFIDHFLWKDYRVFHY